ncbi:NAD kinase [Novosphingobium sp. 9]|uniref:NAD kinase n=1 Tax=Novosphingobium sp. 9 TaxID=2025349 RepID=UPI0021B67322|nr:NAD kinase [Novosphingobium sp. 9]
MHKELKLALVASETPKAQDGLSGLLAAHPWVSQEEADVVVVLGGDGFLLQVLHEMMARDRVKPVYGLNLGTIGFLMNALPEDEPIAKRIAEAHAVEVRPLEMRAVTQDGRQFVYHAINEVSLLRETRQTAKLEVRINGRVRMEELAGDGVLVATSVGSTAYNLSANGPILPLGARMLALTPISPFRPRRWKGAIIPESAVVEFRVREPGKRPVAAVADQREVRDIAEVHISIARERTLTLMFDPGHTLEERIFAEQFQTGEPVEKFS